MNRLVLVLALAVLFVAPRGAQAADVRGVGLGVAGGVNLAETDNVDLNTSFSFGFFVDIPLLETFYVTPAATVYQLKTSNDSRLESITDIDLNFKFIIPVNRTFLGFGITAGLTTGFGGAYEPHVGLLAYVGFKVFKNLDLFTMVQYKRLTTSDSIPDYNNIYIFAGPMFRF